MHFNTTKRMVNFFENWKRQPTENFFENFRLVVLSNIDKAYLGDDAFCPLMEELNKRGAKMFVHPSDLPGEPIPGIPPFAADFLLNTTRAAVHMAKSGWLEKYPNVKIILSHAGGFVPYAAERLSFVCSPDPRNPQLGVDRLKKFYFDTALSSSHYALPCLLAFADRDHITFGSDFPFANTQIGQHFTDLLDTFQGLSDEDRVNIDHENAEKLFF